MFKSPSIFRFLVWETVLNLREDSMKKRLSLTLLIIVFGLSLIAPARVTIGTEYPLINNYDRVYTLNIEHEDYRSTHTLYTYVPPSLYDYYRSESHQVNGERDYAKFVTPAAVRTIAENMRKLGSNRSSDDEDFANDVLGFVHQIPYAVSSRKYPVEALVDNSGDCDVSSFLAASIMKAGGLDVVLFVYRGLPGSHMNIGVYLPNTPLYASSEIEPNGFEYNNKTYWVAECTPTGNWKVGNQPQSFAQVKPSIIPLEHSEESAPALISSSLNSPLIPSSISMTISLENSSTFENERSLTISGSISPAYSGKKVVMYVGQNWSSSKVFQTDTGNLGNYSLTWNVTSTGTYYIRTSLVTFSNYAGSDSELMTFFAGPYLMWVEGSMFNYGWNPDNGGYYSSSSKSVKEFLKSDLMGADVSLSGEFMILKSNQTMPSSEQTVTIPDGLKAMLWKRHRILIEVPGYKVPVQESVQITNQFGFILQNNNGNYSANIRLLSDSDGSQAENSSDTSNSTFMNASRSVQENMWYKVFVQASKGRITAELRDKNGTLLENLAIKEESVSSSECGILISCTPDAFVAFKNLKVENLDQPPAKSIGDIESPERQLELLAPYIVSLLLLGTIAATVTYLRKKKARALSVNP
jgi:hypothetical protein